MKKLYLLLVVLTAISLTGCNKEDKQLKEDNAQLVKVAKVNLLKILGEFNGAEDVDLDWQDPGKFYGEGTISMYNEGELIGLTIFEDNFVVLIEIGLEESISRNSLNVWYVDINYIDMTNVINMELSYYHYDETGWFPPEDYQPEIFGINIVDFAKGLSLFTIDDVKYILTELGYTEVNQ